MSIAIGRKWPTLRAAARKAVLDRYRQSRLCVHRPLVALAALLVLQVLCSSPAWAYFRGQSVYHYWTYNQGWDSTEYTDLNIMCPRAVSAHAAAIGRSDITYTGIDLKGAQCTYEYPIRSLITGLPDAIGQGGVRYQVVRGICPDNSYAVLNIWEFTNCVCNAGYTQSGNACIAPPRDVTVGFFNGVWNTRDQANDGIAALRSLMGSDRNGTPLRYEVFYNQSGSSNGSTALQDIAETFIQRSSELDGVLSNRLEYFWDVLAGRHTQADSLTGRLLSGVSSSGPALANFVDALFNATLGQIVAGYSRMLSNPPTELDVSAHASTLNDLASISVGFVLVAHSQGNLFVNRAYDSFLAGQAKKPTQVVHIAPASPTLRGAHGLSGADIVINGLRVQGINSVVPANWNIPLSTKDASGHMLVQTYLDAERDGRAKVQELLTSAIDVVKPSFAP